MVPVPADRVMQVYALLSASTSHVDAAYEMRDEGDWTDAQLRRLLEVLRSSTSRRLLAALASNAGEWITAADIAAAVGVTSKELRAALSGMKRTVKAKVGRTDMPFQLRSTRSPEGMSTSYLMRNVVAERVKSLIEEE